MSVSTINQPLDMDASRRENLILSSILFCKECRQLAVLKGLQAKFFQNAKIRDLIEIFNGLVASNLPPTIKLIIEQKYPHDHQDAEREALHQSFVQLKEKFPPPEMELFEQHLMLLKRQHKMKAFREFFKEAQKMIDEEEQKGFLDKEDHIGQFINEGLFKIGEDFTDEEIKSMNLSEALMSLLKRIKELRESEEANDTVTTGYDELDKILSGGYRKGYFSLIGARPAMGKTVVMLNQAVEAAKRGAKVLFVSIEMDIFQCMQRVISKVSGVSSRKIQQPKQLYPSEMESLQKTVDEIARVYGKNFFIEEVVAISVPQLEQRIKFFKKQFDVDLVFVDYVQIMRTRKGTSPKDVADFMEISNGLREMAKSQSVAIVLGAQLSRDVEKREDKRPMDSDLKNSGAFEQDAAALIYLYRDAVYNKETEKPKTLEIIIGKNRFGPGNTTLEFTYDYDRQLILPPMEEAENQPA